MKKERVGIFGGTFNPPHNGHVKAAETFLQQMKLDRLIIIPALIPPHKEYNSTVSSKERIDMCNLAFSDIDNAEISDIEIRRGGKSYTYLTLTELTREDRELFFLCGTDMILTMDTWKNPEIIFELASVCFVRRETVSENDSHIQHKCDEYRRDYGARIFEIKADAIDISSSEIRTLDSEFFDYLPPKVLSYIRDKGLYQ